MPDWLFGSYQLCTSAASHYTIGQFGNGLCRFQYGSYGIGLPNNGGSPMVDQSNHKPCYGNSNAGNDFFCHLYRYHYLGSDNHGHQHLGSKCDGGQHDLRFEHNGIGLQFCIRIGVHLNSDNSRPELVSYRDTRRM